MSEGDEEAVIDRIDRKAGMIWSRIGGAVLVVCALALLAESFGGAGPLDRWPLVLGAGLLAGLACFAFRSRAPLSDLLTDGPDRRGKK
ncbi:hypothetical protein N0B51_08855 [Tsuneonella sp. YG55]|uniref:Uncharacterized protein n=1 Tax=Tsuneonella litorea TaxID=2976475 RepID=A0A9X2W2N0_9SPHN|nr:hypothetical protein [Tsuneonella litorea]MCT2559089.1 hypothetical protein [Tsuneonella litorea]